MSLFLLICAEPFLTLRPKCHLHSVTWMMRNFFIQLSLAELYTVDNPPTLTWTLMFIPLSAWITRLYYSLLTRGHRSGTTADSIEISSCYNIADHLAVSMRPGLYRGQPIVSSILQVNAIIWRIPVLDLCSVTRSLQGAPSRPLRWVR